MRSLAIALFIACCTAPVNGQQPSVQLESRVTGNQEVPLGVVVPDDESSVNIGALPTLETTEFDLGGR